MKLPEFQLNDKTIFWGGAITMYVYPLIAWAILVLFAPKVNLHELIFRGLPWYEQLGLGLVYGIGVYLVVHAFMFSDWLAGLTYDVAKMSKQINWVQVVFLSLAAGVGEEILFRVAIQHFFGIWLTAILFVAMHGYLSLESERILSYGLFMIVASAGFGFLYRNYGILSAITAHMVVDLLIFTVLKLTPITRFKAKADELKKSDFE